MIAARTRIWFLLSVLTIGGALVLSDLRLSAQPGGSAPDVIVGDIPNIFRWGGLGTETAFSIATTSCNIGDAPLDWLPSPSPLHPVITQNLYRVADGRIEQIAMSWLKHGFSVSAGSLCNQCQDNSTIRLGVNCSDPYSAGLNGSQGGVGPRSEVNAATGEFRVPFGQLPTPRTVLDGRIRVANSDLDPAQNPGARYFVESQYVHPQDASAGNGTNNASYREAFASVTPGSELHLDLQANAVTVRQSPAIVAWQAVHPDVQIAPLIDIPSDGRVIVAYRTTPLASGGFRTSFAVENLTSHRSIRSLKATFSGAPSNPGFHDVDYQHEPYSGTDWSPTINGASIQWSTATFASDANANALRWGTLYTFWCDTPSRPTEIELGLFRPGTPTTVPVRVVPVIGPLASNSDWSGVERTIDVGTVGVKNSASVGIACRAGVSRSIDKVACSNTSFETKVRSVEGSNQSPWKIELTPAADATPGYFETVLTITTKQDSYGGFNIRVFGNIE